MRSWTLVCVMLLVTVAGVVLADGVETIRTMGGHGVGARALGMGGAYTAVADGPQALYWNPAALAVEKRFKSDFSITGDVKHVDVIGDLAGIYDAIKDENISQGEFNDLWEAAGKASGRPVDAQVGALGGFSFEHFAIGAYGQAAGDLLLVRNETLPGQASLPQLAPGPTASVSANGSALSYYALAAGYGRMVTPDLAVGVAVKQVRVVRAAARFFATTDEMGTEDVSTDNNNATSDSDSAIAADLGLIWWPQPEKYNRRVRLAALVRNIGSPTFNVALPTDTVRRITFEPTLNVGVGVTSKDGRTLFTADIHNLLSANGGVGLGAVGLEHQLTHWLALRIGLHDWQFTKGLTIKLGPFALTAASGSAWDETAALSFSTQF